MKSIVLMIDSLKGGGAERVTLSLAKVFMEQAYHVSIIIMQDVVDFDVDARINLVNLDFKKGAISVWNYKIYADKLLAELANIQKSFGTPVFLGGSLGLTHRLMNLAQLNKAYYFIHGSTSVAKLGDRSGLRRLIKMQKIRQLYNDKKLLCVSKGVKNDVLRLGIEPESIESIYNPFDYEEIRGLAKHSIDFKLPNTPYIVHVGRFSALKRHDLLLKAFSKLSDKTLTLVLVGRGEEEEKTRLLAQSLKISSRVVFAGFQSNPYPIIKNAKLLVLSSDHEGLPTVLIEALALQTGVVSTNCPSGPSEIMVPYLERFLVPVDDVMVLRCGIENGLEKEYPFYPQVLVPFEKNSVAQRYEKLFMNNKPRILLIIDSLRIGGAERVVLTLAQGFVEEGYGVDLITIDAEVKLELPSMVRHISINFRRGPVNYLRFSQKIHNKVRQLGVENGREYELILVHLQKAIRLMRTFSHPHIYFCVHTIVSLSALQTRKGLRRSMKIQRLQKIYKGLNLITVSEGIKKDLLDEIKIQPKSIQTIYNPISSDSLQKALEQKDNSVPQEDYMIHVGRLTTSKRHDRLLQAYQRSGIQAKLHIVGDGEEYDNILQEIRRLGLQKRVVMHGFVANPYPLIKRANLLVLTSDYEGFAIVLVEALMLGTPVVSTNCPSGPAEILTEDLKQYLVEMEEADALSKKIYQVFDNGYNIPTSILERFESRSIVQKYMALSKR